MCTIGKKQLTDVKEDTDEYLVLIVRIYFNVV